MFIHSVDIMYYRVDIIDQYMGFAEAVKILVKFQDCRKFGTG